MATIKDMIDAARENLGRDRNKLSEDSKYYEADLTLDRGRHPLRGEMPNMRASVGWSRLYLDSLVERIAIVGFRVPGASDADDRLQAWWKANDLDQEAQISFLETFIHGRSYVSISAPTDEDILYGHPADAPMIRIESPQHMWVQIDQRTRRVEWAVRFYVDPNAQNGANLNDDQAYTVYLPDRTVYVVDGRNGAYRKVDEDIHDLGIVPIVPSFNRERVADRYGRSEIIPELRNLQDAATQVVQNMQMAADLMAVPQRLLFGVEKEAILQNQDPAAQYKAYMAGILAFEDSEAKATQFSAAELSNYTGVLQELAKMAASYTGLPPQYLSFSSQTPASAEAIRSAESRLVKKAELKGAMFGNVWERVMRISALVMTGTLDDTLRDIESILTDPSTPTYAAKADAAVKLTGGKAIIPVKQARLDMKYTPAELEQMALWDAEEKTEYLGALLGTDPDPKFPMQTTSATKAVDPAAQAEAAAKATQQRSQQSSDNTA
jgi:hypothetical protein